MARRHDGSTQKAVEVFGATVRTPPGRAAGTSPRCGGRSGDSPGLSLHGLSETGTAFRTNISSLPGTFRLKTGTPKIYFQTAESGNKRAHGFCPECGAPVCATSPDPIRQPMGYGSVASTSEHSSHHRPVKSGAVRRCLGRWTCGLPRERSGSEGCEAANVSPTTPVDGMLRRSEGASSAHVRLIRPDWRTARSAGAGRYVYADMAGYSRLIGLDDAGTLKRLRALRKDLMDPAIKEHGGRVVQTGGDSLLIVFDSIDGAVRCAVRVQQQIPIHDGDQPPDRAIRFRIGINMGDAIADGTDLHGDAVNVAARIQAECPPGGICATRAVRDHVHGRLGLEFEELGPLNLKNIARPVEAFVVRFDVAASTLKSVHDEPETQPLPDKPSIAVLAFTNMSADLDQEYFSDGVAEDIITELSRSRLLFVIARNSSFTYKGRAVDVKQVARELGVRYVVEGSVRRSGSRTRIGAQLIDAETGNHIWAERYDRALEDVFAVQDEIATAVATAILPAVTNVEQQRALRIPPENLGAWEAYQRGLWHWSRTNSGDNTTALQFFEHATRLDPLFARAYQAWAHSLLEEGTLYFTRFLEDVAKLAEPLVRKAVVLDSGDGSAYAVLGLIELVKGEVKAALVSADRALELESNSADAFVVKGACLISLGHPEEGCEALRASLRCNPLDPRKFRVLNNLAYGLYVLRNYEEAADTASRALLVNSNQTASYRMLVAALGQLGRKEEAEAAIKRATIAIAPMSFDDFARRQYPADSDEKQAHYLEGMRKAGWEG
jgi:adenylate cyclase